MSNRKWTDEQLKIAIKSNVTFIGVTRTLGISSGPGNIKTIKLYIKNLNLDISHFTGRFYNSNPTPKVRFELSEMLIKESKYTNNTGLKKRVIKAGLLKNECYICKLEPIWNNNPITLQLDHINGDHQDNRIENLRILCPNCHSQTTTFTGRSISSIYRKKIKRCIDCQSPIDRGSERCYSCNGNHNTKIKWEAADVLAKEVVETSYVAVAKRLGVSNSAVKKYIKKRLGFAPQKLKRKAA